MEAAGAFVGDCFHGVDLYCSSIASVWHNPLEARLFFAVWHFLNISSYLLFSRDVVFDRSLALIRAEVDFWARIVISHPSITFNALSHN